MDYEHDMRKKLKAETTPRMFNHLFGDLWSCVVFPTHLEHVSVPLVSGLVRATIVARKLCFVSA